LKIVEAMAQSKLLIYVDLPFFLLLVDLSRKVFVYQRPHHMNPREFEHHLEIGDAGCFSLTTERDELVIQPVESLEMI